MKIPKDIENNFFDGLPTSKTKFGINAAVSIINGPHKQHNGSVISLITIEPNTKYLVELSVGTEVQIDELDLVPL